MKRVFGTIRLVVSLVFFAVCCYFTYSFMVTPRIEQGTNEVANESKDKPVDSNVTPKDLSQYSFAELNLISQKLLATSTQEEALKLAQYFKLVDETNALTKSVLMLSVGDKKVGFLLAGVCQDEGAGLSFVSLDALDMGPMNKKNTIEGGWSAADLRAYLHDEVLSKMEKDAQAVIKTVPKKTINSNFTQSKKGDSTVTQDALWVPSVSEVYGKIDWFKKDEWTVFTKELHEQLSDEGSQYMIFKEGDKSKNSVFEPKFQGKPVTWWTRTPYPFSYSSMNTAYFYVVSMLNITNNYVAPTDTCGIVFGFCI